MDLYQSSKNKRGKRYKNKQKFEKKKPDKKRRKRDGAWDTQKRMFVEVYRDTVDYFTQNMNESDVEESTLYDISESEFVIEPDQPVYKTEYEIRDVDALVMAEQFDDKGLNVSVLNMASEAKPGGGVAVGAGAQEESLFRRTNAFMTHPEDWYPLEEHEVIFSPEVYVVKDVHNRLMKNSFAIGMLAVPAIRKPKLIDGEYKEEDKELMEKKIDAIFEIALENDFDALVLGALGCGAFKNPPKEVAEIFKVSLKRYGKYFQRIGFAILNRREGDEENFNTFREVLGI